MTSLLVGIISWTKVAVSRYQVRRDIISSLVKRVQWMSW